MIETVGKFQDFHKAVSKIDGLEWMAEFDIDDINLDDVYESESDAHKKAKKKGGRWYLSSSNVQALQDLLTRYKHWRETKEIEYGLGTWKNFFIYITDLRFWNEKDRLENTGIIDKWKEEIEVKGGTRSEFNFEVVLHYQRNEDDANSAEKKLIKYIEEQKGKVGKTYRNNHIAFHAFKVTLPIFAVESAFNAYQQSSNYPEWIQLHSIKYCRPIGQQLREDVEPQSTEDFTVKPPEKPVAIKPVVALLDGVPFAKHTLIKDFIMLDDPDGFTDQYEPDQHKHGTRMASLICHNDLSAQKKKSIRRRIYVRPIMHPDNKPQPTEQIPQIAFPEDLIEQAVVRMIDGEVGSEPECPTVKIINLSIGNIDQQFVREMSPWAKLLDWLSWKYKVLFIVSAGNYKSEEIIISNANNVAAEFIKLIQTGQFKRKLLSPAESMNSLTVGAIQYDHSRNNVDGLKNPYQNKRLPSEYSRNGSGFRSQIKPEILVSGGKLLYQVKGNQWIPQYNRKEIGQKVASVGPNAEDIAYATHTFGTSNSAAITTHAVTHLYEVIILLEQDGKQIPEEYHTLVLKSLLIHGASWGGMEQSYQILHNSQNNRKIKQVYSNHLGYGEADFERVMSCTEKRITLIGFGTISQRERHRFQLALPAVFSSIHIRLTATLAWFTPINPFRYGYRQAKLFFEIPNYSSNNREEADWQQVRKGTVQHEIFDLTRFNGNQVELFVQCGADATAAIRGEIKM